MVTAIAPGEGMITVTTIDGGHSASVAITVTGDSHTVPNPPDDEDINLGNEEDGDDSKQGGGDSGDDLENGSKGKDGPNLPQTGTIVVNGALVGVVTTKIGLVTAFFKYRKGKRF